MNITYRTAVILCGGKGTRLGSLSKKIPKTLVKIQGKEVLWYIINILKLNNFNHFILPLGYKSNSIKKFVKKNNYFNTSVEMIETGLNSNIGKRIYKIEKKIRSNNFLLMNGDAIFDFNLKSHFIKHKKKGFGSTFVASESIYQYGTIGTRLGKVVDFNRNITHESLNLRNKKNYLAYSYSGILILNKHILSRFRNKYKDYLNFEKQFFPKIIKKYKSNFVKLVGFFHSIDNIKDIDMVNNPHTFLHKYKKIKNLKKKITNLIKKNNIKL